MIKMDMYGEIILEHYKHPQNQGKFEKPSVSHEEYNPLCGDKISMQLLIDKDKVKDVKFSGKGCAISIAAASLLTDAVKGKSIEEIKKLDKEYILDLLGVDVNPARIKCATIGLKTLKIAVFHYLVDHKKKAIEKEFNVQED